MRTFIISLFLDSKYPTISKPFKDNVFSIIDKNSENWMKLSEDSWLVTSEKETEFFYKSISDLHNSSNFLVVEIDIKTYGGYMGPDRWAFMREHVPCKKEETPKT